MTEAVPTNVKATQSQVALAREEELKLPNQNTKSEEAPVTASATTNGTHASAAAKSNALFKSNAPSIDPAKRRRELGALTIRELREERGAARESFLIENWIEEASVNIVGGDSGLGKSPLCYQLAMCVCLGVPFLGFQVKKGRAVYVDLENSSRDILKTTESLSLHLGGNVDNDLMIVTDQARVGTITQIKALLSTVNGVRLLVIDSLRAFNPRVERKNDDIGALLSDLKQKIARPHNVAVVFVHHLRKPSQDAGLPAGASVLERMNEFAGGKGLVNQTDTRILFSAGRRDDIDLMIEGHRRIFGNLSPIHMERVFSEKDEDRPLGYRRMSGASLLFNHEMEETWTKLTVDKELRRKDIRLAYGKTDPAAFNFINKCLSVGILRRLPNGKYLKILSETDAARVAAGPPPTDIFADTPGASSSWEAKKPKVQ